MTEDCEDIREIISNASREIKSSKENLTELEKWATDVGPEKNKERQLDEEVEKIFLNKVPEFKSKLEENDLEAKEVVKIGHKIQSSFNEPIQEAIETNIKNIITNLKIEFISDEKLQEIFNHFKEKTESLNTYLESLKTINEDISSSVSDYIINEFKEYIKEDPDKLKSPDELESFLSRFSNRFNNLKEIENEIKDKDWCPEKIKELSTTSKFYKNLDDEIEVDDIKTKFIENINSKVENFNKWEISLDPLVLQKLKKNYNDKRGIKTIFEYTKEDISFLNDYESCFENINILTTEMSDDDYYIKNFEDVESFYDNLRNKEFDNLKHLQGKLDKLKEKYEEWQNQSIQHWRRQIKLAEAYENQFGLDLPSFVQEIDSFENHFEEDFENAIIHLNKICKLVKEKEKELEDKYSEESVKLIKNLGEGKVRVEQYSIKSIKELQNEIPLILGIDENNK